MYSDVLIRGQSKSYFFKIISHLFFYIQTILFTCASHVPKHQFILNSRETCAGVPMSTMHLNMRIVPWKSYLLLVFFPPHTLICQRLCSTFHKKVFALPRRYTNTARKKNTQRKKPKLSTLSISRLVGISFQLNLSMPS